MGMVVKYADNILKNFANALSVIFTVIGAMPLFGQYPSFFFLFGVAGVLLSVFMYGKSTPSGFGAFDSCYRSMSTANLQLLLQSSSSGTFLTFLPLALPCARAHACTSTLACACRSVFCCATAITQSSDLLRQIALCTTRLQPLWVGHVDAVTYELTCSQFSATQPPA